MLITHTTNITMGAQTPSAASLRHAYLGSFFLEPEDIKSISPGAIWNINKATGLPYIDMGHKGPVI
jgi:hypothetical protein